MVSDFNGLIGCWDLNCFRNQGTTFASCAFTHVKVPGWLSNLKALLTKKLPKFLSSLNEMSGGREKMYLVLGSLRRILKFLRTTFFYCNVLWMLG